MSSTPARIEAFGGDAEERLHREATRAGQAPKSGTTSGQSEEGRMSGYVIRCSHDAVDIPKGKRTDYATFRKAALKAGRFSVWEACENPVLFDRLCHDPEIFTDNSCGFPWTRVRLREVKA